MPPMDSDFLFRRLNLDAVAVTNVAERIGYSFSMLHPMREVWFIGFLDRARQLISLRFDGRVN